ncbi:hypothetical protein [Lutispora saccharofermentans]|uniref:Uncharacterized protein n=1 Tax=Lutispora saccharofermentans TaxID=3024236 RepID=A0ABT1NC21_9FIRM|nr:hypothetical protein [Lutispora saccharofermentans]MCQ1528787.1 hypothetical protein [Lutispora saccharofermentans]
MKENTYKYIILLLLMGTSILYLTKADLASVIQFLMVAVAIFITDSLYRLNNKIWNIALILMSIPVHITSPDRYLEIITPVVEIIHRVIAFALLSVGYID